MRTAIVYESMYGNTRAIAEAIGSGIGDRSEVTILPVAEASLETLASADLLIVGGPTHAWGMSRPATRESAATAAEKPGSGLVLEPGATGVGLREWFETHTLTPVIAAAFDTQMRAPMGLSGSAARRIEKQLRRSGFNVLTPTMTFYVTKANELILGEQKRAQAWGAELASAYVRHVSLQSRS